MLESLRARLLLWYTLVLAILISIYAGTVTYAYWRSRIQEVDRGLTGLSGIIRDSLHPDESGAFDVDFPPRFRETAFGAPQTDGAFFIIWNADGALVDRSNEAPPFAARQEPGAVTDGSQRIVVVTGPAGARILVGRPLDVTWNATRDLGFQIAGAGGAVLLLSLAGGFFLAGRALAPIAHISRTAAAMAGGDLGARIPVHATDSELEQLAGALNNAFDRLQGALEQQQRFTADASHEFRTPLATLRADFEWALRRDRPPEEYRQTIARGEQAVQRLTDLSDRLLTLARGAHRQAGERVDLTAILERTLALAAPVAQAQEVTLAAELAPVAVTGDQALLADACSNLVANAIQYNRPGGKVEVSLRRDDAHAWLVVHDTGVGIAESDLPHIFDRFYRVDPARTRARGGAGLGLAIVREVVQAHGGTVTCTSVPGEGSLFTLTLPLVA